ncbi:MAG: hypothetical protein OEM79_05835 [Nitrosopumilus sp.]|nr:hypothetical protein [Nitrosopumilus sp.]
MIRKRKIRKEKYEKFEPTSRQDLLKQRLSFLTKSRLEFLNEKKSTNVIDTHISILEELQTEIFNNDSKTDPQKISEDEIKKDDQEIYRIVQKHLKDIPKKTDKYKELSPFVFIKRYSKSEQYDILPETMRSDFDDIPDENGMSKFEVVETIQQFGEILNTITNKEKDLNSKLDCSIFAEQYLDTLEQIATLYRRRVIPKKAADYFENKFAYGINLLNWYSNFVENNSSETKNNNPSKFNPEDELSNDEREQEKEERWTDFKWFCRGGDLQKHIISQFKEDEKGKGVLPDVMYDYNLLPNEEGLKPGEVLEIMRNYSKQLTDLSGREPELKTQIDCSVYAEQYLDTLEQIAYLFNNKSLVTDSDTYFENNFTYGLTLKKWYTLAVIGAKAQENRWTEFDSYCKNFRDKNNEKMIEFEIESVLPPSMLNYQHLPTDLCDNRNKDQINYKREEKIS